MRSSCICRRWELRFSPTKQEELPQLVEDQVRLALFRLKATRSLKTMVQQARCRSLELDTVAVEHFAATPRQQTQAEHTSPTPMTARF
jgi:hypothetical protein